MAVWLSGWAAALFSVLHSVVHAAFGFPRGEGLGVAEGYGLGEDGVVAGDSDVLVGDEEQPQVVVAEGGASAEMQALVPPVEDVAFGELVGGMVENLSTGILRVAVEQRHHVLQLVPEARGAANLVEARAGVEARGVDLVEVPAVQHVVQGAVGRLDLDVAELLVPVGHHAVELGIDRVQGGWVGSDE